MTPNELAAQFAVPGLTFTRTETGLVKGIVDTPDCTGAFFLHGAHVVDFKPADHQGVLWTSRASEYADGKAIRGGIPICFPWFGPKADDPGAPSHGWARTRAWELTGAKKDDGGPIVVRLETTIDAFQLAYTVGFGTSLSMDLAVTLGSDATQTDSFELALHTYFSIGDIHSVTVEGLQSAAFIDKVDQGKLKPATGQAIRFDGECDRVYLDTTETCRLVDPKLGRTIEISKSGSHSTVVWNPWIDKSARMADFGDDEWPQMVCIESACVGKNAVALTPGSSHTTGVNITARR